MNYPILMYPAQTIRDRCTGYIGGEAFWFGVFKRLHPEYVTTSDFDWKEDLKRKIAVICVIIKWVFDKLTAPCRNILGKYLGKLRSKKVKDSVNVDWSKSDPFPNPYELQVRLNNEADPGFEESEGSDYIQKYFPTDYDPSAYTEKYKMPDEIIKKKEADWFDSDSEPMDNAAQEKKA